MSPAHDTEVCCVMKMHSTECVHTVVSQRIIITEWRHSLLEVPCALLWCARQPVSQSVCLSVFESLVAHHEGRWTRCIFFPKEPLECGGCANLSTCVAKKPVQQKYTIIRGTEGLMADQSPRAVPLWRCVHCTDTARIGKWCEQFACLVRVCHGLVGPPQHRQQHRR